MIGGAIFMLLLAAPAAPGGYVVYPVRASIDDDTVIGPLQNGLACVHRGKLRWSAFAVRSEQLAEDIAGALRDAGLAATAADLALTGAGGPAANVSVEITAVQAEVCRPRYGLLKLTGTGLKGKGTMQVRWRIAGTGDIPIFDGATNAAFTFSAPGKSLGAALRAGVVANAKQLAPRLTR